MEEMEKQVEHASDAPEVVEEVVAKAPKAPKVKTAHDDFNWNIGKRNDYQYPAAERASFESQYDDTLSNVNDNEIIKGRQDVKRSYCVLGKIL